MWVPNLDGLSETARSWLLIAAIAASAFGAGAGLVGWVDMPGRVQANMRATATNAAGIHILAENDISLADQLAVTRCTVEDLSNYECDQLRAEYRQRLENPDTSGSRR